MSNDLFGVADLLGRLSPVHSYHFVCEYTGIYYLLFASALVDAGYPVSVCNPVQIANFARMRMVRTKTDKKDAELIALFGRMTQPGCWVPPGVDVFKLRSLHMRAEQLIKMRTMEKNRLQVVHPDLCSMVESTIVFFSDQLGALNEDILRIIRSNRRLTRYFELILSILCIGDKTASILVALLHDYERFQSVKHLISYVGLSPVLRQSGTSLYQYRGISKQGSAYFRKSLRL